MRENKRKIRVFVFANRGHTKRHHIEAVSGHVQVPLIVCNKLYDAGYDVTFITPEPAENDEVLAILKDQIKVILVCNATPMFRSGGLNRLRSLYLVFQLYRIFHRNKGTIVHFFGMKKVGLLLGLLSLLCGLSFSVFTPVHYYKPSKNKLLRGTEVHLLRQIDCILPTSEYLAGIFQMMGVRINRVLRPGVYKDFKNSVDWINKHCNVSRKSVLYWRDATRSNGVDIAIEVYRRLAPKYPGIDFVFAIRHIDSFASQIESLSIEHSNVHVHFFPYRNGISLIKLFRCAICVLLPMRDLSIHPQYAILETIQAGVPLITTNVESNPELIESDVTGFLIEPGDIDAAIRAIETLIHDSVLGANISINALKFVESRYSYDLFLKSLISVYGDLLDYDGER